MTSSNTDKRVLNVTKPEKPSQLIIISDLDGSLLDHHSYSFAPAEPLLEELILRHVPVVLCTSKTEQEVLELRHRLNNHSPFIVENGAAVFLPREEFPEKPEGCQRQGAYWVYEFCPPREHWLQLFEQARAMFPDCIEHFATMTAERVAELTGLSLEQAGRAQARGYGEPMLWSGSEDQLRQFTDWFEARGARVLKGGRFIHVAGASDKGRALQWLVDQYQQRLPEKSVVSMALGDSHNDVAMLEQANFAVVIRSPAHPPPQLKRSEATFVTDFYGPEGWVQGVQYWCELQDL